MVTPEAAQELETRKKLVSLIKQYDLRMMHIIGLYERDGSVDEAGLACKITSQFSIF